MRPANGDSAADSSPPMVSIAIPQLTGGGAEKVTLELASDFHRRGWLSRVYTGETGGAERFGAMPLVDLGAQRAAQAALAFGRAVRDDSADVFLLTLGYIGFAPIIRRRRSGVRVVLRIGNTPTPELAVLGRLARIRYRVALRIATSSADAIVVQSEYMASDLARIVPTTGQKLRVIYNPVEDGLWEWQAPPKPPLADPYLFCAASMKPQKGFDLLLAAYAGSKSRSSRRLVVAGVAPDDNRFSVLMSEAGLSDSEVLRLGFVEDVYNWVAHSEVCVLASRFEGFSNFLLEAAALGKRIVATDCPGGNAELFATYPNAEAVPAGDTRAMAAAMDSARADLDRREARSYLRAFEQDHIFRQYEDALFEAFVLTARS